MRCLVRYITRKGQDGLVRNDTIVETGRLIIGRRPDCDVYLGDLRVAHEHALLSQTPEGDFRVVSSAPTGIRVESEVRTAAVVRVGDMFSVGSFELRLKKPPATFDLRLDVEQVSAARGRELEDALRSRSKLSLDETRLRRRPLAWGLFLATFFLFGVLPVTGYLAEPVRSMLRASPLPSDGAWDPGPLGTAHHIIGDDCNACHEKPFVQVRDTACTACHSRTPAHVIPASPAAAAVGGIHCRACHRDHKGDPVFTRHDEALCTDCHADLMQLARDTTLGNVTSFGTDHPPFRASMFAGEGVETRIERVALDGPAKPSEHSNLHFPHDVHLAPEGVETVRQETRVLGCADCHQADAAGLGMVAVDFETHCHECHSLSFAAGAPEREVMHGKPEAVLRTIEEYYARLALEGGYTGEGAPGAVRRLRRPGERLTPDERKEAMEWVHETSLQAAAEMFEYRVCAVCHTVRREPGAGDGGSPRWQVLPVRVADHWLPKARFSHRKHSTMACADCHEAGRSSSSEDVLIEGIASCRECHGGEGAHDRLASRCVDCHAFHVVGDFMMGAGATSAKARHR